MSFKLTDFITVTNTGNVGIGTSSIEGKLTLNHTAAELPSSGTTSNSAIQIISSLNNQLNIGLNTVSGDYGSYIQASDNNLAVPYPLFLQPNGGNIGIGTLSPTNLSSQTSLTIQGASVSRLDLLGASGAGGGVVFGTATAFTVQGNYGVPLVLDAGTTANMNFNIGGSTKLTITSDGQVGIGATPGGAFDVSYDAAALNAPRLTDTRAFAINNGAGLDFMGKVNTVGQTSRFGSIYGKKENSTDGNTDGYLQFQTNNVERMRISSGGDVTMSKPEGWRFISSGLYETYISNQSAWNSGNYNSLVFSGRYRSSANDATALGEVRVIKEQTTNDGFYGGEMSFWTRVNGGSMTQRLTISSGGDTTFSGQVSVFPKQIIGSYNSGTAGTAALPSYAFYANEDMGMYPVGTDTLGFSTAGTNRLTISPTGTAAFSSPNTTANVAMVTIRSTDSQGADVGGTIGLGGSYGAGLVNYALIRGAKENSTNNDSNGYMSFTVHSSAGQVERMRISSNGETTISTTASNAQTALTLSTASSAASLNLSNTGTSPSNWYIQSGGGITGALRFYSNVSGSTGYRLSISSAGAIIQDTSSNTSTYFQIRDRGTTLGYFGSADALLNAPTTNTQFAIRSEDDFAIATGGGTRRLTIASGGAATFSGNISLSEMATITVSDISTGENRGLKLENTGGGGKTWNVTPGLTGSNNSTFTIRNATDNINALTISSAGSVLIPAGNNPDLDINGTLIVRGNSSASGTHYFTTQAANVAKYEMKDASGNIKNEFSAGGNSFITGGNVSIGVSPSNTVKCLIKGIGTTASTIALQVNRGDNSDALTVRDDGRLFYVFTSNGSSVNDVTFNPSTSEVYYVTSSRRYKENIKDYSKSTLDNVLKLKVKTFDYINGNGIDQVGLIAEEVNEHIPELVPKMEVEGFDEPQPNSVRYSQLSVFLLKAMQEQQAQIEELKSEIQLLKNN